jgi:lysophospholipid acyltransferase (LPLAT)-like uncharacterized protein
MLGFLVAWIVRAWLALLRVRVHGVVPEGPVVWVFWHGAQMALLARKRRPTAVLVSLSKDGELQAGVMRRHGMIVVRGSSSRRAAGGLRGLLRELAKGRDVAFAVDGPRGPLHRAKPGAIACARSAGAKLVPLGVHASSAIVLRAWDRFVIPLPFSRVDIAIGPALDPDRSPSDIERAIHDATTLARYKNNVRPIKILSGS